MKTISGTLDLAAVFALPQTAPIKFKKQYAQMFDHEKTWPELEKNRLARISRKQNP